MKILYVNRLNFTSPYPSLEAISDKLDGQVSRNNIDEANLSDFPYKPDVKFAIGHTDNEIMLKYFITEEYFKAEKTISNQMVCEDSCVEFFVSPAGDGIYYNMEFNGTGTCLMGSGTARENNNRADPDIISGIRRMTSVGKLPVAERTGQFSWDITIAIPVNVFFLHTTERLGGKTFRANFYKCGDKLSVPHYLTWNPVNTRNPDFHQPDYFGILKFQ
ncbi:MAG: carbohydrate-binding family 9-like protein [Bacteroidales bacterium]|jgi:hypothetical protein